MAYTETSTKSYGSRLGDSLKGILVGIVLFIAATALLFWNEGNAVKTAVAIKEAEKNAVHVDDVASLDPNINGKLIHASAFADTKDVLTDSAFGISVTAIKLNREVLFYQWKQHEKKEEHEKFGGSVETVTTYTYDKTWSDKPIDSNKFKDPDYRGKNTLIITGLKSEKWFAQDVSFGAYKLPSFLIKGIDNSQPLNPTLSDEQKALWQDRLAKVRIDSNRQTKEVNNKDESKEEQAVKEEEVPQLIHVSDSYIYLGRNPESPEIGDIKISYSQVLPTDLSLIAKVNGSTFEEYFASNGKSFYRIKTGIVSLENMIKEAKIENSIVTWILRLVGLVMLYIAFTCMFGILSMLLKWFPFLGKIGDVGVGIISIACALIWGLLVMAVAWLFYRPFVAVAIFAAVIAAVVFFRKKIAKKNGAQEIKQEA